MHTSVGVASLWLADDVLAEELALDAGAPRGDAGGRPATSRGGDAGPSPWVGVEARRALRLRGRFPLDSPSAVASALASCARAAGRVQQLASTMNDADAGRRGELAAESVEARGVARAACAVAAVRVALAGARPEDEARLDAARAGLRDGP